MGPNPAAAPIRAFSAPAIPGGEGMVSEALPSVDLAHRSAAAAGNRETEEVGCLQTCVLQAKALAGTGVLHGVNLSNT